MPKDPNWGNILKSLKRMRARKEEAARSQVPQYTGPEEEEEAQPYETPANISAMPNTERSGTVMNPSRFQGINENTLKMNTENSLGLKPSFDYLPDKTPEQLRKQQLERNVASDDAPRESYLMDKMSGGISGFKDEFLHYGGDLNGQVPKLEAGNTSNMTVPEEAPLSYRIGEGARDGYEAISEGARDGYEAISSGISGAGTLLSRFAEGLGQGWEAGRPKPPVATTTNSSPATTTNSSPATTETGVERGVERGVVQKKNIIEKDSWGRSPGDKWFGFNSKTNTYEEGDSKVGNYQVKPGGDIKNSIAEQEALEGAAERNEEQWMDMFKIFGGIGAAGFAGKGMMKYFPGAAKAFTASKFGSKFISPIKKVSDFAAKFGTKVGAGVKKGVEVPPVKVAGTAATNGKVSSLGNENLGNKNAQDKEGFGKIGTQLKLGLDKIIKDTPKVSAKGGNLDKLSKLKETDYKTKLMQRAKLATKNIKNKNIKKKGR